MSIRTNKQKWDELIRLLKSVAIGSLISPELWGLPATSAILFGLALLRLISNLLFPLVAFVSATGLLLVFYFGETRLLKALLHATEKPKLHHRIIEYLAEKADLNPPKVLWYESQHTLHNAFALAHGDPLPFLLLPFCLADLPAFEGAGIILHELAHLKKKTELKLLLITIAAYGILNGLVSELVIFPNFPIWALISLSLGTLFIHYFIGNPISCYFELKMAACAADHINPLMVAGGLVSLFPDEDLVRKPHWRDFIHFDHPSMPYRIRRLKYWNNSRNRAND